MVLVKEGGASTSPARDLGRAEAWDLARHLRAQGRRVWIVRITGDDSTECIVDDEQSLDDKFD